MRMRLFLAALAVGLAAVSEQAQQPMAMPAKKAPAAVSTSLTVTVAGKDTSFTVADLDAMPPKTVQVHNEHTNQDENYAGVLLSDVLAKCGATYTRETQKMFLHSIVRAIGTDQYFVIYSATEVEGGLHSGDVLVATKMNGAPLGEDGNFKLVSSEDRHPARWVRNLTGIVLMEEK